MEKRAEKDGQRMSAVAQDILRDYGAARWPTLNHKGRINRLAGHLRWGFRRVRSLYNNEDGVRLRADEMAALEGLKAARAQEAENEHVEARRVVEARLAQVEEELAALRTLLAERGMVASF